MNATDTTPRHHRPAAHATVRGRALHATLLLVAVLSGVAVAQTEAHHDIRIRIPNYVGIKIIDASGNLTGAAGVTFDYTTDPSTYFTAAEQNDELPPTSVSAFEDVQVFKTRGWWSVYVRATNLSFDGVPQGWSRGLDVDDIRVRRGSASGLSPGVAGVENGWRLESYYQRIAHSRQGTGGWQSLGFNGEDYLLSVNGDEDPGTYITQVTYLLTNF